MNVKRRILYHYNVRILNVVNCCDMWSCNIAGANWRTSNYGQSDAPEHIMIWDLCLSFSNIALDLATLSLNGLGGVGDLVKVDQCVLLYAHVVHFKMKYFTGTVVNGCARPVPITIGIIGRMKPHWSHIIRHCLVFKRPV